MVPVAAIAVAALVAGPAVAKPVQPGFKTDQPAMLAPAAAGVTVSPIITVGDMVDGYRFESIPDGIAIYKHGKGTVDVFVNHETSRVPFPLQANGVDWEPTTSSNGSQNDFDNSQLSMLRLHQQSGGVLEGSYVIPSSANYQRFCSNFLATAAEGFSRPILFTNEEATDFVSRTGEAYPAPTTEPPSEQAGVVVAYDVKSGEYRTIYGMGRHNHENSVAIPGYDDLVLLSGDDTFSAPSSQVYSYVAADTNAVWNDEGRLFAFRSDNPAINDYGDLLGAASVSGRFIPVPDPIADGPQGPLESWSNAENVFQFIRIEDIAYDRNTPNVVYLADTGEPRALPGPGPARMTRGPSGTLGPFPNGRIFKMTLNPSDPLLVDRLEILFDADVFGYGSPGTLHNPDNLESTARSLLIQEDPGGHNLGTPAKIWRYDLATSAMSIVAVVVQSEDGGETDVDGFANGAPGAWESTGIVDVSSVFGPGTFLVNIQAGTLWVEKDPADDNWTRAGGAWTPGPDGFPDWMNKRSGGQMLLITIPGS
jgi:hypothetical protein